MGRIMAIDYGMKRVGIAVTDPDKIIATALTTVHAKDIISFLKNYFQKEKVECIVVGEPLQMSGKASEITPFINAFIKIFTKQFPAIPVKRIDERFSSKMASQSLIDSGVKKMQRRNKELVDMTSAVILLQSYMNKAN